MRPLLDNRPGRCDEQDFVAKSAINQIDSRYVLRTAEDMCPMPVPCLACERVATWRSVNGTACYTASVICSADYLPFSWDTHASCQSCCLSPAFQHHPPHLLAYSGEAETDLTLPTGNMDTQSEEWKSMDVQTKWKTLQAKRKTPNKYKNIPPACTTEGQPAGTILKFRRGIRQEEIKGLKAAHALGIPAPAVLEVRTAPEGHLEFLMELVPGDSLETVWPDMSATEKEDIARQLGKVISLLRTAPRGEALIGGIGGPARDLRYIGDRTGGPFATEADFNDFQMDFYPSIPDGVRRAICQSISNDHQMKFSHADLSARNIIVKDGCITGLVDWEFSG